jgi:hypothetical protein
VGDTPVVAGASRVTRARHGAGQPIVSHPVMLQQGSAGGVTVDQPVLYQSGRAGEVARSVLHP